MVEQTVVAEMISYGNVTGMLGLSASEGLDYLWWDTLQVVTPFTWQRVVCAALASAGLGSVLRASRRRSL